MTGNEIAGLLMSAAGLLGGGLAFFSRRNDVEADKRHEAEAGRVTDNIAATSSASASVTVQLSRRYISITAVQVTAQSGTQANPSYSNVLTSETTLSGNTLQLDVYNQTNARLAVPCSITVTGVAA